jgi:putative redox protein
MDARPPVGRDTGPTPKEMLLGAIAGCAGVDVAGHFRKSKVRAANLSVAAEATAREEHPRLFPRIDLTFSVAGVGAEFDPQVLIEGIHLSLTKYCGVSAMVAPTSPIFWKALVNNQEVAHGQAKF